MMIGQFERDRDHAAFARPIDRPAFSGSSARFDTLIHAS
jgi:hypothetical protein